MENTYVSHWNLPSITQLTQQRIESIPSLVNNLKFHDVEQDSTFKSTKERIKKDVLFQPILLGEPKFIDYNYQNDSSYTHEIRFPFKGDKELFLRSYNGMSFSSSDHGVIEPYNSEFIVYVNLNEINPDNAVIEAETLLRLTKNIGLKNSESITIWNTAVEERIDNDLEQKRSELFRIFAK